MLMEQVEQLHLHGLTRLTPTSSLLALEIAALNLMAASSALLFSTAL